MKSFENILICCDLDCTFIGDDLKIPEANFKALVKLRRGGGRFTLATGRTDVGMRMYLDEIKPDTPVICQNGSAIYESVKGEYIWNCELPKTSITVLDYIKTKYPRVGIEVMTTNDVYCCLQNDVTIKHAADEHFTFTNKAYEDIHEPWLKAVFADFPNRIDMIQAELEQSDYSSEYTMSRSTAVYYEIFAKNANKANGVKKLAELTKTPMDKIVVLGDNDNDCEMLSLPCLSLCPANASERAKRCADIILERDNNMGVLEEVLQKI